MMKIPLSIYVFYHKNFEEGAQIYSEIYKLLGTNEEKK